MATWLAALIAAAAVTATYFTCVRPMRRKQAGGRCADTTVSASSKTVDELREELRTLRGQKDIGA